jgi:hypothetical protein
MKRRVLIVLVALVAVSGGLAAVASPVGATSQPIGNVTCQVGGSLSFNPPLTPSGTQGGHEKATLTETLSRCVGPLDTMVPSSPKFGVKTAPFKHFVLFGHFNQCSGLGSELSQSSVKQTIKWGPPFQPTKVALQVSLEIVNAGTFMHELGHNLGLHHGGAVNGALGLTAASAQALQNCSNGIGGPIASVIFDPNISSMTAGTTVLTTGSLGGSNVAVGDLLTSPVVGGPSCTSGNAQAAVQFNPAVLGTAALQLTALTFSNCSIDMVGVGPLPATVVANDLPSPMSVGDGAGDPATLGLVSLTISVNGGTSSCSYASPAALTGGFTNATNSLMFSGSPIPFTGGTGPLASNCPTSALSLPVLTSVTDSTQSGSPLVFVN